MINKNKQMDERRLIYPIGAGFLMLILNPNSDMVHILLSTIIGFLLYKYFQIKEKGA